MNLNPFYLLGAASRHWGHFKNWMVNCYRDGTRSKSVRCTFDELWSGELFEVVKGPRSQEGQWVKLPRAMDFEGEPINAFRSYCENIVGLYHAGQEVRRRRRRGE